ncbi:MAG TPA: hypothetical protein DGO89_18695 [Microcoleaceae bacterium UBA9251]|nr:hypothetical protein [Microcoleaceae cyanobacterium UBA9251]
MTTITKANLKQDLFYVIMDQDSGEGSDFSEVLHCGELTKKSAVTVGECSICTKIRSENEGNI